MLSALLTVTSLTTAINTKAVDAYVTDSMKKAGIPGISVAIVQDGRIAYAKGYGYADLENEVRATPKTVYQIGSITKQFTATLVMKLVEDGKVKLDDPIRIHMSDLPEKWQPVTIRHLLTHTSGIKSYTNLAAYAGVERQPGSPKALLDLVGDLPLEFNVGEKRVYNNSGYYLLGMLVERKEGKPFAEVLTQRILRPVGMAASGMNRASEVRKGRARGYYATPNGPVNADTIDMGWPFATGAMLSSVEDLAKWDAALLGAKVLSQKALEEMWTPYNLNNGADTGYGFGWVVRRLPGTRLVEHNGGIPGFQSMISRYTDKRLTVVVLANANSDAVDEIAHKVAAIVDPSLAPPALKVIADASPEVSQRLKRILGETLAGNAKASEFGPDLFSNITSPEGREMGKALLANGSITKFELVRAADTDGGKVREYIVGLGTRSFKVSFNLGKDGRVEGLLIRPAQ